LAEANVSSADKCARRLGDKWRSLLFIFGRRGRRKSHKATLKEAKTVCHLAAQKMPEPPARLSPVVHATISAFPFCRQRWRPKTIIIVIVIAVASAADF
jgi:hypothetical protein